MRFGENLQFECPDNCPTDCAFANELMLYGQNAICGRCPVLLCKEPETEEDKYYMPMVEAEGYRDDWGAEWDAFFKTGTPPQLKI